jgi:hypothetical protein
MNSVLAKVFRFILIICDRNIRRVTTAPCNFVERDMIGGHPSHWRHGSGPIAGG